MWYCLVYIALLFLTQKIKLSDTTVSLKPYSIKHTGALIQTVKKPSAEYLRRVLLYIITI